MNEEKKKKSFGNKAAYIIYRWIIKYLGVNPAYHLLIFVIAYYVLFRPGARRVADPYISHRFPNTRGLKKLWLIYKHYYNFGLCLIDQAAINILGPGSFKIDFPDGDDLRELAEEGRGIVFLTSHIGIWQQAISALGFIGREVYVNMRFEFHSKTMGLSKVEDVGVDLHIISPDNFLGGVPELSSALLRGQLAAVMGDRTYGMGTSKNARFLGDEALFPLLPHHLALTTNSDLVVFLTSRLGKKHFLFETKIKRITAGMQEMSKDEARTLLLEWYVRHLENYVENHPFMWYNFIDFWKK